MADAGAVAAAPSPTKLRELIEGLDEFKAAYLDYLEHGATSDGRISTAPCPPPNGR